MDSPATNKEVSHYFVVDYDISCCLTARLTEIPVKYESTITDSVFTLNYYRKNNNAPDTITYILKADKKFKPEYLLNGVKEANDMFLYVSLQTFTINNKDYRVYKYVSNPLDMDGCVAHFWTPSFGVILTRSITWRNFRKLQSSHDSINNQINLLVELMQQEIGFYYGCLEQEMELIPKEEADSFYQWKSKNWVVPQIDDL